MIDLHLFADRSVETSVVFDGATALRLRTPTAVDRLNFAVGIDEAIGGLQELKEHVTEFVGSPPERLTAFRLPGLAQDALERIEAAAFAAGIEQFETVGLGNIAQVLFRASRSKALLLVYSSRECLSGTALSLDSQGKPAEVRKATVNLSAATIRDNIVRALERGDAVPFAGRARTLDELVERYWDTGDPHGAIDAREWGTSGWVSLSLGQAEVMEINKATASALKVLLEETFEAAANPDVIVMGEGQKRVSALLRGLGARVVAAPASGILDAMVLCSRSGRKQPSLRDADNAWPEARLLFDPRAELGTSTLAVRRDNAAVRVPVAPGQEHRLEHIPAKWHRAGFDVEITVSGKSERVRLFKDRVRMDVHTFTARIASRCATGARLLMRIAIPELGASALVVAQAGREPLVAHYAVRIAD